MDYESEVVSADTGTPVEAPVAEPQPEANVEQTDTKVEEAPAEPIKEETPADTNLVELPDGRKLPPKEAEIEYRNLYSEFTRKSQKLATYEKSEPSKITNHNEPTEEKEWIPQTWEEVKQENYKFFREQLDKEREAETQHKTQIENNVVSELAELKKEKPTLNENQLFQHALKYNFSNLKAAYSNMNDMQASIKKATETTAQNIQKRNAEPVSGGSQGGTVFDGDVYDPSARNMSLVDYLRSLK